MGHSTAISIANLHYAYPSPIVSEEYIPVLHGVDLEVFTGELLAVMGRTGAGKSTLCLAINGIVPHTTGGRFRGHVIVQGDDTRFTPVAEMATRVGIVFQDPESQFFHMAVEDEIAFGLENLGIPPAEIETRIEWALHIVGMSAYRRRSPFHLSGGQKQRVAIAAALAMRPTILILDEPTSGLDPLGKRGVFQAVQQLTSQHPMTVVMVEQEAERIAEFSDRVAVLDAGRIAAVAPPRELFRDVERLHGWGLDVPQVSELSARINHRVHHPYPFINLEESYADLVGLAAPPTTATNIAPISVSLSDGMRPIQRVVLRANDVPLPDAPSIIQVKDLVYRYPAATDSALEGIRIDIHAGDFVAIVGQNGSGKTTLVKHFNGLYKPTAGQVLVDGRDTRDLSVAELARTVGFVFQNPDHQIFCRTTWEELAFGPRNLGMSGEMLSHRVEETLALFDLQAYADLPPATLSVGLRRKVSVAAVCAMRPRVLVLDEPTAGLDRSSALSLMALLRQLNAQGHTIVLVTHDMKLVTQFAYRTLVLDRGRVLAYDDTRSVFQNQALLTEAQLAPPQITALAQRLAPVGMPGDVLTVAEFERAYTALCSERTV